MVVGDAEGEFPVPFVSLAASYGPERALADPLRLIEEVVAQRLAQADLR